MSIRRIVAPLLVVGLFSLSVQSASPSIYDDDLRSLPTDHFMQGIRFDMFDLHLCQALYDASPTENVAVSPVSVKLVLAMVYEAARGETAQELQKTLGLPVSRRETRVKFGSIHKSLNTPSNNTDLRIASNLFVKPDSDSSLLYQRILQHYYSTNVTEVDFTKPKSAAKVVNDWVNEATNGKITSMLDPNDPEISTLSMVISNALYFKGSWKTPFNPNNTREGIFYLRNNKTIKIDMMVHNQSYYYAENFEGGYTLLRLPYLDDKYSMYIVLPSERYGLDEVLSKITPDEMRNTMKSMQKTTLTLMLPKFSFQYAVDLEPILIKLGIKKIFDPNEAELTMISNSTDIYVSRILHKAGLEINEFGSTVYAATHVEMEKRMGHSMYELEVDHPFMFIIKDDTAETIVFAAKVENPVMTPKEVSVTTPKPAVKPKPNIPQNPIASRLGNDRTTHRPGTVIMRSKYRKFSYKIIQKPRTERQFFGYGNSNWPNHNNNNNNFFKNFNNFNQQPFHHHAHNNFNKQNFNPYSNLNPFGFNQQSYGQYGRPFTGNFNPTFPSGNRLGGTNISGRPPSKGNKKILPPSPVQPTPPTTVTTTSTTTLAPARTPATSKNTPVTPARTSATPVRPALPSAPSIKTEEERIREVFGTPLPANTNTLTPTRSNQQLVDNFFYNINNKNAGSTI